MNGRTVCALMIASLAGFLLYLGCTSPFTSESVGGTRVAFPHAPHTEEGLECGDCHETSEDTGALIPVALETCEICHEGMDEGKPDTQQVSRFYDAEGRWQGPTFSALAEEVIFDHAAHAGYGDCASCHGEVGTSDSLGAEVGVPKPECLSCHQEQKVSDDCATCHSVIRRDLAPSSHRASWMQAHGRSTTESDLESCSWCHDGERGPDTCEGCHLTRQPTSHTNQFRRRGHGLLASIDRRSCQTCHQTDFCVRCHSSVEPTSHKASFGSPRNRHCVNCHEPVSREPRCAICHATTPSHQRVPPMPPWHTTALDCRQCHGAGQALRHPDNGDDCINCHRR